MALLALAAPAWARVVTQLPGAARSLAVDTATGEVVVAALGLRGVAFIHFGAGSAPLVVHRPEWRVLDAMSLPGGRFLLAGRFGTLILVEPVAGAPLPDWRMVAEWPCEGVPTGLAWRDGHLMVAAGAAGVVVYEWERDATAPQLRGRFPMVDYSKQFAMLADGAVLLADNYDTGFQVLDTRDPRRPRRLGMMHTGGFVDSVASAPGIFAFADRNEGVALGDASNPAAVVATAVIPLPARRPGVRPPSAQQVAFGPDNVLLVCEGTGGARFFHARTGGGTVSHTLIGQYAPAGESIIEGIFLPGRRVLLACESGRLLLVNVPAVEN